MTASNPDNGGPRDRPALSAPKNAALAAVGLYLFWGYAPVLLMLAVGNAVRGGDPWNVPLLPAIILTTTTTTIMFLGVRNGRVWAIRLLRGLFWLAVASTAGSAGVAALVATSAGGGGLHDNVANAHFTLIQMIVLVPLGWWLSRLIRHTRWLDPTSSPGEWEPAINQGRRGRR